MLQNNGGDDLTVASGATSFTFATKVSGAYAVTVKTQPTDLLCTITSGSGTASADVTNVGISCVIRVVRNWGTFTDMKDGTIKFEGTAGTFGGQTYTAQTLYFAKCTHGKTWRVPTKNELKLTIQCTNTAILPNDISDCGGAPSPAVISLFTNTVAAKYWSANTYAPFTPTAWFVDFQFSSVANTDKLSVFYVRCVSGP